MSTPLRFETIAAKTYLDGQKMNRPLSTPLVHATTFQVEDSLSHGVLFRKGADSVYQRFGHPTVAAAEKRIARLEEAEGALLFASGMGAITSSLLAVLQGGGHVVAQREIFAQTFTFLSRVMPSLGVDTDFVAGADPVAISEAIRPDTKLIYLETPSNPLLLLADVRTIAEIARERDVLLFVDSTFATPYLQTPLSMGASLVLHSGTKFLGGHSDVMCGVAAGGDELLAQIRETQLLVGNVLAPYAAWLLLRGVKTLAVRVQRQCENALALARLLSTRSGIRRVHYPFLEGTDQYRLATDQMRGGGGVVSFEVEGGLQAARAFADALQIIPIATSLGGVETVIEIPFDLDFGDQELGEAAEETGISPGLIRLSVGIEDIHDLAEDLEHGLDALARV